LKESITTSTATIKKLEEEVEVLKNAKWTSKQASEVKKTEEGSVFDTLWE
jgi:hypothetical protein